MPTPKPIAVLADAISRRAPRVFAATTVGVTCIDVAVGAGFLSALNSLVKMLDWLESQNLAQAAARATAAEEQSESSQQFSTSEFSHSGETAAPTATSIHVTPMWSQRRHSGARREDCIS